ncbi:hypothetical protein CDD80_3973 [Ophiocordyceps camponoti-rufipedis]|uniref:Uncharacterized protein n=1 Tax=Ophiocordyceps camponoti-rufipedis TaxID=2004952 RepID=A0A2C5ZIU2_9HYPO|nr:hypothetical protein CDD80_3973 [Ophiocordyceps camponoti-rufipedis]
MLLLLFRDRQTLWTPSDPDEEENLDWLKMLGGIEQATGRPARRLAFLQILCASHVALAQRVQRSPAAKCCTGPAAPTLAQPPAIVMALWYSYVHTAAAGPLPNQARPPDGLLKTALLLPAALLSPLPRQLVSPPFLSLHFSLCPGTLLATGLKA